MPRILVAEDDADGLELTVALFKDVANVHSARTCAHALRLITKFDYDLLVTDLDLGPAGDGLILVGAMRALHPKARNVLITGFPDFGNGLADIQAALDLILLKPVEIARLRELPKLATSPATGDRRPTGILSLWDLIARDKNQILGLWLKLLESDPVLTAHPLTTEDRLDHYPILIEAISQRRRRPEEERQAAEQHGHQRREHHYRPEWIFLEISYFRRAIFDTTMRNLLDLDLSSFPQDMFELNLRLDSSLLDSLQAFGLAAQGA